jgi:hypothetical protein
MGHFTFNTVSLRENKNELLSMATVSLLLVRFRHSEMHPYEYSQA